jgi:hypothetical protein
MLLLFWNNWWALPLLISGASDENLYVIDSRYWINREFYVLEVMLSAMSVKSLTFLDAQIKTYLSVCPYIVKMKEAIFQHIHNHIWYISVCVRILEVTNTTTCKHTPQLIILLFYCFNMFGSNSRHMWLKFDHIQYVSEVVTTQLVCCIQRACFTGAACKTQEYFLLKMETILWAHEHLSIVAS